MKNGSIKDKLQMQEQELKLPEKPLVSGIEIEVKREHPNVGMDVQPNYKACFLFTVLVLWTICFTIELVRPKFHLNNSCFCP